MNRTKKSRGHDGETTPVERIKKQARARRIRRARALAARMQIAPDGSRIFIRFSPGERREHQILLVTFTILAVTGLLQRYSKFLLAEVLITLLGGVETIRTIHHLTAVVFIALSIYHAWEILVLWVVKR